MRGTLIATASSTRWSRTTSCSTRRCHGRASSPSRRRSRSSRSRRCRLSPSSTRGSRSRARASPRCSGRRTPRRESAPSSASVSQSSRGSELVARCSLPVARMSSATDTSAVVLADLLASAERAVVLTGAGISVPSGIPDFRTPGKGLWEKVDPMKVAHVDAFRRSPDEFWTFYGQRFAMLSEIRPNPAHEAVAELERRGAVRGVITQNIDRLHRAAGSRNVIEVHGSIEWCVCEMCGGKVGYDDVNEMLAAGTPTPECSTCITPLKPNVVLFGEMLPEDAMADATALAAEADLMLCVGSSLEVYPVAGLPGLTLDKGGRIALVTQGRTPYDRECEVKLSGDVVAELGAVLAALS